MWEVTRALVATDSTGTFGAVIKVNMRRLMLYKRRLFNSQQKGHDDTFPKGDEFFQKPKTLF